ncbi:MAG: SusC/RagA family TonB-linked outer membrane protein, partial [Bacteroidales bacterium]
MKKIYCLSRTGFTSGPAIFFGNAKLIAFLCMATVLILTGNDAFSQDRLGDDASIQALVITGDNQIDSAIPQALRVTGTVSSETDDPLAGATVQVEGTALGTITDINGRYTIDVPSRDAALLFSFVGYVIQRVPVEGRTTINVSLIPTVESLSEVVVVGYGTQRRSSVTGSVSIIKGDEVAKVPVANITNSIAGKLAGVSMRPNGGQPGEDNPDIYIRGVATTGTNRPLIVVDGIIRDNINQIDPTIIESVSVLKDAAAVAPYGMGGANGVVLITTKRGETSAPTLTLNTYYGLQTPTYYPSLLNAKDYMRLRNESYLNENPGLTTIPFPLDRIENYDALNREDPDLYPSSDTDDLIDFWNPIQNHNLQLRGGSERVKYFAGAGYYRQDGLFDDVNYSRFNYTLNLESKVTSSTTVSVGLIGSVERTNDLDVASSANQLFRNGYKFLPTEAIYYSNGLWGQFAGNSPVAVLNSGGYEKNDGKTLLTTLSIEQQIPFIKGLSLKGTFSYDTRDNFQKGWHRPFIFYAINTNTTPYSWTEQISTQEGSVPTYTYLTQEQIRRQFFTYQGFVNYQRIFGRTEVTGLLVAESRNNTYDRLYSRRNNFAVTIDELDMGSSNKNDYDNGGSSSVGAQIGYVYRLGFVHNSKYMLEASGRYDGHYYFAPGKRWGYFPAFSAGWRISQEDFMKNLTFLDNLKIRASWGKSGNLAGDPYQYLSGYILAGNGYAFGTGAMVQRAYVSVENNPNITWEVSAKTDVGFETSFWNSLLMIEFDYFFERRTGMLL